MKQVRQYLPWFKSLEKRLVPSRADRSRTVSDNIGSSLDKKGSKPEARRLRVLRYDGWRALKRLEPRRFRSGVSKRERVAERVFSCIIA